MNQRNILLIFFILLLFAIGAFVLLPKKHELTMEQKLLMEKQQEAKELNRQLDEVRKVNHELEHDDPRRLSQAARDNYKYCYPNEKIYSFPEKEQKKKTDK